MAFVSVLDLFTIGIGPSSSHTVGPMRAACRFLSALKSKESFEEVFSLKVELYGSLAMTGKGHATDIAILLGLEGETPEGVDPDTISQRILEIQNNQALFLNKEKKISFSPEEDLLFLKGKRLPYHSNALRMKAFNKKGKLLLSQVYYSIGGGFVLDHEEAMSKEDVVALKPKFQVPYPFSTAFELMAHVQNENKEIWEIALRNEVSIRPKHEVQEGILKIWQAMQSSVQRGVEMEGELLGGLGVKRRARGLFEKLSSQKEDPSSVFDWVSLFALAVNEENAAGSRVVTAPTNGSAGVIPAVLHYAQKFLPDFNEKKIMIFFLTASAIGYLFKRGASISAAEMGCQGEIGVSSSMAAAGLAAIMGGTSRQIENAAEIAMEHHLGMTCDPVAGLVQIPCIERNTMGAIKAINAARLACYGDGEHIVSLDAVIRAMKETGENMKSMYKETSVGGLALQVSVMETVC